MTEILNNLTLRMRRNRKKPWLRDLVAENQLSVNDLILPIFVTSGKGQKIAIDNFPDQYRFSIDLAVKEVKEAKELGINAIILFPVIEQSAKSVNGQEALNPENITCQAIREIKKQIPDIGVICDVALDPYTIHGHDGILDKNGDVDNDKTIEILAQQSLVQAQAGCDIIAPSDMMDGRIQAIRKILDENDFKQVSIMSYCAKYASSFYGPFRSIIGSDQNLQKADKKTYQMDFRNSKEAIRQAAIDQRQGADMLIVKPAMPYLDIVKDVSAMASVPVIAYQVSGEYSMLKFAALSNVIDLEGAMFESLSACKRAGASAIITYFAMEVAKKLKK